MDCSCFDAEIDGFSTALSDKIVTARKSHRCGECHCAILKGQQYRTETILYDRVVDTHKTCLDCCSVREHLVCYFYYGEVWDLVENSLGGSIPWSKIAKLTPKALWHVCEKIERMWDDEA